MPAHTIALLILGFLTITVGSLMQLIAAFRQSIGWGLASLFLPFASLVFIVIHWAEAKAGFLTGLAGAALVFCGVLTCEPLRTATANAKSGKAPFSFVLPDGLSGKSSTGGAPKDVNAQIQEKRDRIEQLENEFGQAGVALVAQFQSLNTQRTGLNTNDPVAVAQFNAANTAYQAQNAAQKQRQQELATLHQTLDELLAQRSKSQAQPGSSASTGGKQVIMYTTATCPACRAAKEYFARKGVHYQEHDVNTSPAAREEFQRLGGRGVPLILVGNEKMEGFSAQRLDQLL